MVESYHYSPQQDDNYWKQYEADQQEFVRLLNIAGNLLGKTDYTLLTLALGEVKGVEKRLPIVKKFIEEYTHSNY